ncbi:TonB-dependent receptor [Novosphingobium sp.]|uniref:TonB-dependent receptor n=1 Tax=Novosphingobium sp. TaxID=1874826 RepID=UPI0031E476A0
MALPACLCTATPASAGEACKGIALAQALVELGQKSGITLAFNAARVPRRCVSRPRAADPFKALAVLAQQSDLRLVTLRPNLYALLPAAPPPPRPMSPRIAQDDRHQPAPATLAEQSIVVIARNADSEAASMVARLSTTPVDVVSGEAMRRLPATSAADGLRLVPGLQFDNERGNGIYLFARGLDSSFHLAKLDGRTVAINDLIENGTPMGRSFRFEMLPADLIDTISVAKTGLTGDSDPTIGITADVKTPRPFAMGRQIILKAQQTRSSMRPGGANGFSGLASWVNDARSFGILAQLSSQALKVRNDRFLEFEWEKDAWPGVFPAGTYTPGRVRPTIEMEDRQQKSTFMALQWQPAPGHQIELTVLRTRLDVHYTEYGLDIYPDDATYNTPVFEANTAKLVGNTVVAGTIDNVRWMGSLETSLNRHDLLATGAHYTGSAGAWQWSADLAYSNAHSYQPGGLGTSRERIAFFAPLTFDFSGGYRQVASLSTNVNLQDSATYQGWIYNYAPKDSLDTDASARLDVARHLDWVAGTLRGGIALGRRTRRYWRRDFFIDTLVGETGSALASQIEVMPIGNAFAGATSIPTSWLVPKAGAFNDLLTPDLLSSPLTADDLAATYNIIEDSRAAYGALDMAGRIGRLPVSGTLALRVNQTRQLSSGYEEVDNLASPVSYARTYTVALPSLALRLDLAPSWVLRVDAARSFTPPNLTDLAPRFTTSLENRTASGGNPDLKPFTGTNVDVGLSYYGPRGRTVSLTLFQRYLDNYLTSQNQLVNVPPYGDLTETITVNGKAAIISGAELAWSLPVPLPHPLAGRLTFDGSVTANGVHASFDAGDRIIRNELVGLSRLSMSARGHYTRGPLGLDLAWFWRSRYMISYGSSTIGEEYVAPLGTLDGQISWKGPRNLLFGFGVTNITDARKYLYGVDTNQPNEINTFGRRFVLSVTWKRKP